jgi:hypothetical protein
MTSRALLAVALLAGCAPDPSRRVPDVPVPPVAIVEASLGVDRAEGPALPPGAPPSLRPAAPGIEGAVAALRSERLLRALGEELGTVPNGKGGIAVEVLEEAGEARIRVRAPHPAAAMAACRAYARIAEAEARAADPVEPWLVAEIAETERSLAGLDRELALLPPIPALWSGTRGDALVRARIRRYELAALDRGGMEDASSPILAALLRLAEEARQRVREGAARGRGPAHPEMRAAAARARWLDGRLAAQRTVERAAAVEVEAAVKALPERADRAAVGRALGARLRGVDVEHATALDPAPLQILAVEAAVLAAEDQERAGHLGQAHPERAEAEARLSALRVVFARERDLLAAHLEAGLDGGGHDPRPFRLDEEAARLATLLARLAHWRETARPARLRIRSACALRPVIP